MDKKFPGRQENPNPKPWPHQPESAPSTDSRDKHGLSKDEALQAKK